MGALVSTIMLTALFTIPLTIAAEEYDRFYASHLVPTCEQINLFGTGNATSGVLVGKCKRHSRGGSFARRWACRAKANAVNSGYACARGRSRATAAGLW